MKKPNQITKKTDTSWFEDSIFNLLVDYYPEVPFRPYGSGATRENVLPVLKDLRPGYILIYAKGHSGYTTFPSSLRTQHNMLGQDMPAFFREVTRETGTRFFLYYSGMFDGIASVRHPEWRMKHKNGEDFLYHNSKYFEGLFLACANCPLSAYFDEWVAVHLREMITRYDPDGIWVDGDWGGPCYCPRCEARFRDETGHTGPMPDYNLNTPAGVAWVKTWLRITHEWRTRFNVYIKSLKATCMYSAGNVTARREFLAPFDWRSGDWFSPNNHRLHMSLSARQYTTLGIPYDAFICDTSFVHSRPQMRSRTKTLPRMLQEGATLIANGAQWGHWTYPMPNGAFVPSKMRIAKKCADFARERKDICLHTEYYPWTAILNSSPDASFAGWAGKALIALHRSPVIIDESALTENMAYDLIVIPEQSVIEVDVVRKLALFVRQGGKLLTSGASIQSSALQQLLGVRVASLAELDDGHVFRKDGNPTGVYANWDRLVLKEAKELYPLYLSWDQFNPELRRMPSNWPITGMVDEEHPEKAGFPAATVRKLGKGLAVHIPTEFFRIYWDYGNPDMLAWLREILEYLQPNPFFYTDAPSFVEVVLRKKGKALLIHFINGNPGRDISLVNSDDYWVDDIPVVGPIKCKIRCTTAPGEIMLEPGHQTIAFTFEKGILRFEVPRLEIHNCVVLKPRR